MIRVTVYVEPALAQSLREGTSAQEASPVRRELQRFGASIVPQHPGVADAELQRYFAVDVADQNEAQRVIDRLQACDGVEAAYVKPPEGIP